MDDEHGLTEDEFNKFDWAGWYYEGKHFEARAVSRSEFEALKRFGDYEELPNSIPALTSATPTSASAWASCCTVALRLQ